MKPTTHHVVPNPKGGWDIKQSGKATPLAHAKTKAAAIKIGRQISKKANTEFVIHKKNGRIQQKDSHGKDPNPPKG